MCDLLVVVKVVVVERQNKIQIKEDKLQIEFVKKPVNKLLAID